MSKEKKRLKRQIKFLRKLLFSGEYGKYGIIAITGHIIYCEKKLNELEK
jgi:hypothetical protein